MPSLPDPSILDLVKELQKQGRYLDAWDQVKDLAPPEKWPTAESRLSGALLIDRLGDSDRATKMVFRAWHDRSSRAEAREDMFWEVLHRRGAYLTWKWLQKYPPNAAEPLARQADYQGYLATALMRLGDFQQAEACLCQGEEMQPGERWFAMLRADLLQAQDLREEALEVITEVVKNEPDYVSAIDTRVDLLIELGCDDEAVAQLRQALQMVQAGSLARRLTQLLMEMTRHDVAEEALALYEKWMPLMDQGCQDWVAGVRCDLASHRLDHDQALHWARLVKQSGFYTKLVTKLESFSGTGWRRVILPVPFVQQHHSTCAPASLTSIAEYWGHGVEHLELADEICYDGTPDYRERNWAEGRGWSAREFKVTVENAQQLIDAGMPFVLNTVYPGGAHAQVVMGYDDRRTVLFIRDPGDPHTNEFLASESLEGQAPFGPRGFVLVPVEHGERLAALDLAEVSLYDLSHQIHAALAVHARSRAQEALEELRTSHPTHVIRWRGELTLGRYDGNQAQQLQALDELLKLHPAVEDWQTARLSLIQALNGREDYLAGLAGLCAQKDSHPLHWMKLARELHWDDRHLPETRRLLRRVLRHRVEADAIVCEADLLWRKTRYEEATQLYRLAACFDFRNEDTVMAYFKAARCTKQTDAALGLLRQRFELEGERSSQPAVTLYRALDMVKQSAEALTVLEQSIELRPDDVDHAVYVAGEMVLWNRLEKARLILASVTRSARAAEWHRVQARLAAKVGDAAAQMQHQRAILEDHPLDSDAHRAIASLLDLQEGGQSGLRFLKEACGRYSCHWHLHLIWLDWARDAGTDEWETVVTHLLRIDPHDAWARRELADVRRAQERFEEAHSELDQAAHIDSSSVTQFTMRGSVLEEEGREAESRECYRQAVCLDVDNGSAQRGLVRMSADQEERVAALRIIQAELKRQTTQGEAVTEFAGLARAVLEGEELESCLRAAFDQRPDLWQTGATLAEHLRQTDREPEAVQITEAMTRRFPLMSRVWLEHGLNLEASGQRRAGIEAMEKVRELNPDWSWGMRHLSEMMRKEGDYDAAKAVLEEALRHDPQDSMNHGWLGEVLWDLDEREEAIAHLTRAVELAPGYNWAWGALERWGRVAGKPDAVKKAALRLQSERPGEARTWMIAVQRLIDPNDLDERLAALDKAISLSPDSWGPAELKAQILGEAGRYDEALAICREHESEAIELRIREAWLLRRKGAREEAVKVLEEVVADDPRHAWPWQLLTDWHEQDGRIEDAERACRMLARVQPDEPQPLGYLGTVLITQKKRAEGKAVFAEAVEQFPHYEFAFQRLFWLHVEDREWEPAEVLLKRGADFYTALNLQSRWFVIHCRRARWPEATAEFEHIIHDPDDDENALIRVREALDHLPASHSQKLLKSFQMLTVDAMCQSVHNPRTGGLYVHICRLLDVLPDRRVLDTLPEGTMARQIAFNDCIEWAGDRRKKRRKSQLAPLYLNGWWEKRYLDKLISDHHNWLRSDADLYGIISYAFHVGAQPQATIAWLSDWRERGVQLKPYILNNLILALHETRQHNQAQIVARHGVTLAEHNGTKMRFHIWLALEHLLQEQVVEAEQLMAAVNPASLDGYGKILLDFYQLLREHQADRPSPPSFVHSKKRLEKFLEGHPRNALMKESCQRACALIGRRLNSMRPKLWYTSRPWLRLLAQLTQQS